MEFSQEQLDYVKVIRSNAANYAQFRLGIKLHPTHANVLNSLFDGNPTKVSFRAANNVGKTSSVSLSAILYAIEILGADVIYTSASNNQVQNQMIPKLKALAHLFPNWEFQDRGIKINGILKLNAFSTSDGLSRIQGFHSIDHITTNKVPLLIIVDEAAGVKDEIFQAISKCFPSYLLIMGSPIDVSGVFYSIETEPVMASKFKHFKLTQHECLEKDGYWIKEQDIKDYIETWGGYEWLVLSTIYAEFSSTTEGGLISLAELNKCYEFPPIKAGVDMHVGIDVAASGGDYNVIAMRIGNEIKIMEVWREPEVMRACDKIATTLNELKFKHNITAGMVSLDADGMGIGFISRLKDLGWNVNAYHGNATHENPEFASKIAEDWLMGVQKIKKCAVILPDNAEFKLQILSRKQAKSAKGKLTMESKAEMKSRGVHSPDIADAVFISMSNPVNGNITTIKQFNANPQGKKYSFF